MQFSVALLTALFASSALAAPSAKSRLAARVAARRSTSPPKFVEYDGPEDTNVTHVSYSENWSGAVLTAPPAGSTFTAVSAQFVVPTPKKPSGGSSSTEYSASAWVGIDGDTATNSILQTGVDFNVEGSSVSYDAWYEWYPDYAYDFSGISISAGDTIALSVSSSSKTAGTAKIENLSTGQTVTKSLSSSAALAGQNAEWIVEDFEEGNSLVPLANFGTVEFTSASYKTSSGATGNANGAQLIDIKQGSTVYTSASESGSTVTVTYE